MKTPESPVDTILAQVRTVATLPSVALQINRIVGNPHASVRMLQAIVEEDQALAANIVRVANSPIFGYAGGVGSLDRAIFVLGFRAVRNIAMATSLKPLFRRGAPGLARLSDDLWRHALATGVAATLAASLTDREALSDAFLAGMLHDIGLTALAQYDAGRINAAVNRATEVPGAHLEIELETFGVTHQQVGAALLRKWRFPRHLVDVAGAHHDPEALAPADRRLPSLVRIADWLAAAVGFGFTLDVPASIVPSAAELDEFGLTSARVDVLLGELLSAVGDVDELMRAA